MHAVAQAGGNPSSQHQLGQAARRQTDRAEAQLLQWLGLPRASFVFLGDALEADAWAIEFYLQQQAVGAQKVCLPAAMPRWQPLATLLRRRGVQVVDLCTPAPDGAGAWGHGVKPEALLGAAVLAIDAFDVATGVCAPVAALYAQAQAAGVPVHVAIGAPCAPSALPALADCAQTVAVSAASVAGPQGVAALLALPRAYGLPPAGTVPRELVVGFGASAAAACAAAPRAPATARALAGRRDQLEAALAPLQLVAVASDQPRQPGASLLVPAQPADAPALAALVAKTQQSGFNVSCVADALGRTGMRLWLDGLWPSADDARFVAQCTAWRSEES